MQLQRERNASVNIMQTLSHHAPNLTKSKDAVGARQTIRHKKPWGED
jgi:hypothetical protein